MTNSQSKAMFSFSALVPADMVSSAVAGIDLDAPHALSMTSKRVIRDRPGTTIKPALTRRR